MTLIREVDLKTGIIVERQPTQLELEQFQRTAQEEQVRQQERFEQARAAAYKNEADPLFFKWQRGEATQQEWLDKINEIRQRFPKNV